MELAAAGASAARASVALKRSIASVRMQASKLGTPFLTTRIIRKNQFAKCAAAERVAQSQINNVGNSGKWSKLISPPDSSVI
jgi:hypothetical protein